MLAGLLGLAAPGWAQEASVSGSTLTAIAKRPELWPRRVKLKVAVPLPGKDARSIAAGVEVKVVGLEGSLLGVDHQGELVMVPLAQTDFLEAAALTLGAPRPAPAAPTPPATAGGAPSGGRNLLGLKLDSACSQVDGGGQLVRSPLPAADKLATKGHLLLQLGGSAGFASALGELRAAVKAARTRGIDFAHVLVPRPGATAEATLQLAREGGFVGPVVDPGEHALINELWTRYGHSGPFALALVNARGEVVARTLPMERGVDKFHAVLNSLQQITATGGALSPGDVLADAGEPPGQPLLSPASGTASPAVSPAPVTTAYAAARTAFRKRQLAELDALAECVTRERSLSRVARLELEDVFAAVFAEEPSRPDVWPSYLAVLEGWVAAAPGSSIARVALAGAWMDYAWLARGHGYADTVTAEGWQLFHERTARARAVLEEAAGSPAATRSPHWYAIMLNVARAQNWTREANLALAQEGIAAAPWYHPIYHALVMTLLPRWHGHPGDWQAFAHRAAEQAGTREGPLLYACLVGRTQTRGEELFLTPFPVDWALLRTGYEQLVQRYPEPQLWRQFCQLACLAGDRQRAREAFAHASFAAGFSPWRNEGEVAAWRAWAEGGELPLQRIEQEKAFELWKAAKQERERRREPDAT